VYEKAFLLAFRYIIANLPKRRKDFIMEQKYFQESHAVINEVKKAVIGKDECIRLAMAAILAGGHILIDDIPGVGKTTLAMAFAGAMELDSRRVQFTPDVMPADVLGFSMYQKDQGAFVYQPGAVMCNLFLADEINRTSPKTQSALLEVMEEGNVTVDGVTRQVPEPFVVIATENPVGSVGTQLLPESQLDRFMICMTMGYPNEENEIAIAKGKSNSLNPEEIQGIIPAQELLAIRREVDNVYLTDEVYEYIVALARATRTHDLIELGVSPRGTIAMAKMAKAVAFLSGRDFVIPDDVTEIFPSVAGHRIVPGSKARVGHVETGTILQQVIESVKKPRVRK
jgi:MoxR-like ATPase